MSFLRPNIDTRGRIMRAVLALLMAIGAFFTWPHSSVGSVALATASAFVAFEASRGWCALRACGVKTKF